MATTTGTEHVSARVWPAFVTPAVAVLIVLIGALHDSVVVRDRSEQARVTFGWPLVWLQQDQTAIDPPYPYRTTLDSPWENPTNADLLAFLVDVALVLVALVVLWLILGGCRALARATGRRLRGHGSAHRTSRPATDGRAPTTGRPDHVTDPAAGRAAGRAAPSGP